MKKEARKQAVSVLLCMCTNVFRNEPEMTLSGKIGFYKLLHDIVSVKLADK